MRPEKQVVLDNYSVVLQQNMQDSTYKKKRNPNGSTTGKNSSQMN